MNLPEVHGNAENGRRIGELLAEGQAAFERRAYQTAIDAWSRIYLIDADHAEATRRIDEARSLNAERERQAEEIYHEALSCRHAGDVVGAARAFTQVLALQPNHAGARDQIRRLERIVPPAGSASGLQHEAGMPTPARSAPTAEAQGVVTTRREPTEPQATERPARRDGHAFVWIGGAVLLLAAVSGWLLYSQRQQIFPNSHAEESTEAAASSTPLEAAQALYDAGQSSAALRRLEGIPPESAHYPQAQRLLAQWRGGPETTAEWAEPAEEDRERRAMLLGQARVAHSESDYLSAYRLLEEVASIAPLEWDAVQLELEIERQLAPVADVLELYRNGAWEMALPRLREMRDSGEGHPFVERLLADGYYNLAVRDLQRNAPSRALERLFEAQDLTSEDPSLDRVVAFARTYENVPPDLRYRLFVKYLPMR